MADCGKVGKGLIIFICSQLCIVCVGTPPICYSDQYVVRTDDGDECCPKCLPGKRIEAECTARQSTSCTACDGGTYMDTFNEEKQCHQCLNCTEGTGLRQISSCKFDRNTVCAPLEGFFCVSGSVDRCVAAQRHSTCRPGQYINKTGTSSNDTVCGDCTEGTFSNGTSTFCHGHKRCSWLLRKGTIDSDSTCVHDSVLGVIVALPLMGLLVLGYKLLERVYKRHERRRAIPGDEENEIPFKVLTGTPAIKCPIDNTLPPKPSELELESGVL